MLIYFFKSLLAPHQIKILHPSLATESLLDTFNEVDDLYQQYRLPR